MQLLLMKPITCRGIRVDWLMVYYWLYYLLIAKPNTCSFDLESYETDTACLCPAKNNCSQISRVYNASKMALTTNKGC